MQITSVPTTRSQAAHGPALAPPAVGMAMPDTFSKRGAAEVPAAASTARTQKFSAMRDMFDAAIKTVAAAPTQAARHSFRHRVTKDVMYEWLFRPASLFGDKPLSRHGFFIPKGSDIIVTVTTKFVRGKWRRAVQLQIVTVPDGLGAWGPMKLRGGKPLAKTRMSKLTFTQSFDTSGKSVGERTKIGVTFANSVNGETRDPKYLEKKALDAKESRYRGTTLYTTDITQAMRAVWRAEAKNLAAASKRAQKRTGRPVSTRSAGSYLALLSDRLESGQTKHRSRIATARRALGV